MKLPKFHAWLLATGRSPATACTYTSLLSAALEAAGNDPYNIDAVRAHLRQKALSTQLQVIKAWSLFASYIAALDPSLPSLPSLDARTSTVPDDIAEAIYVVIHSTHIKLRALEALTWSEVDMKRHRIRQDGREGRFYIGLIGGPRWAHVLRLHDWGVPANLLAPLVPCEPGSPTPLAAFLLSREAKRGEAIAQARTRAQAAQPEAAPASATPVPPASPSPRASTAVPLPGPGSAGPPPIHNPYDDGDEDDDVTSA